jgi:flotillin
MPEILQSPAVILTLVGVVGFILLLLTLGSFFRRYYNRASSDEGLIRTGAGGQKVVIDGGIWVFPILHEISKVSLRTIRKEIRREGRHDSLITQDNIRVNIIVEFYIKVQADQESVLNAARSLGKQTVDEKSISELMEGKLTDALRSVSANKKFLELHQQRQEFAAEILKELNTVIHKNGFTLESVSITNLNQTPLADLDERDYFDSQGARAIVEIVERARQDRNKIELESATLVAQKNFDEEKKNLAIKEQQSRAQAETARRVAEMQKQEAVAAEKNLFDLTQKLLEEKKLKEVETQKMLYELEQTQAQEFAQKKTETQKKIYELEQIQAQEFAQKKAETDRSILLQQKATETAQLEKYTAVQIAKEDAERQAMVAQIEREKQLEAAQIERQKAIETARIEKEKALQTAEIAKQRAVDTSLIETEKSVEAAKVDKVKAIEQANLDREVSIVKKMQEKADADAARLAAIALKEEAEQKVITVQQTAAADRARSVTIIQAEEQAKKETIDAEAKAQVVLAKARSEAESQRLAAEGKANYDIILAKGLADAVRIKAEADAASSAMQAQAIRDLAIAGLEKGRAEAEARRLSVIAENSVSSELLIQRTAESFIQQLPSVVHELMKPAEAIKEIKILQVQGVGGNGTNGEQSIFGAMNPVVKSIIDAGAAMPVVKELFNFAKQSEALQKYIPKNLEEKFEQLLSKNEQPQHPEEDQPAPT